MYTFPKSRGHQAEFFHFKPSQAKPGNTFFNKDTLAGMFVGLLYLFDVPTYLSSLTKLYPDLCFAFSRASRPQVTMLEGRSGSSSRHQLPHALGGRIIGATLPRDWTCRTYSGRDC